MLKTIQNLLTKCHDDANLLDTVKTEEDWNAILDELYNSIGTVV